MPLSDQDLRRRLAIAKLALLVQLENIIAMEAQLGCDDQDANNRIFDSEHLLHYLEKQS